MTQDQEFDWSTASIQLAASLAAVGFPVRTNETEFVELQKNGTRLRYYVGPRSMWGQLQRDALLQQALRFDLVKADPYHPFLQAQRAAAAYMTLLQWVNRPSTRLRLSSVPSVPHAWQLVPGEEDSRLTQQTTTNRTNDLPLAAALAVASGVPIIDVEGTPGSFMFRLPAHGLRSLMQPTGDQTWSTIRLIQRQQPGKPALALETTDPQHPLVSAYQGAYTMAVLNAHVRKKLKRMVLLKAPHSKRRAYISDTPTQAVLEDVRRHFRIPG